jgi:hypothetical protein
VRHCALLFESCVRGSRLVADSGIGAAGMAVLTPVLATMTKLTTLNLACMRMLRQHSRGAAAR